MRNFNPKSVQDSERLITRKQDGFGAGMFNDIPGSKIPENGVKYSENYHCHGDRAEPRGGGRLWGDWSAGIAHAELPTLRTGYSLTKSGTTVTKTVGTNFTSADVGNYIIYDDGKREKISAYISGSQVTMDRSDTHAASTAAKVGGPVNVIDFHHGSKKVVLHIDTRIFISDDLYISNWVQCYNTTPEYPLESSVSVFDEKDDYVFLYNPAGQYKLDLSDCTDLTNNPPVFYKINTVIPTTLITDVEETDSLIYGRKYLYMMSRIDGTDANRDRHTTASPIKQVSGPCAVNDDFKDYGLVYTTRPVGLGDTDYQVLVGGALTGTRAAISWWANDTTLGKLTGGDVGTSYDEYTEWTGITDGEFIIEINSYAYDVVSMDFSSCTSMGALDSQVSGSVAEVMENAIRGETGAEETVRWDAPNRRFIVRSALDPDSSTTIQEVLTPLGGTDISIISGLHQSVMDGVTTETAQDTTNMQFGITIDGVYKNLSFDSNGVDTFINLAEIIETVLQDAFGTHVSCGYSTDHFEITVYKDGGTTGFAVAGTSGFNVNEYLELDSGSATVSDMPWSAQSQIGTLTVPVNPSTSNPLTHWTHYSVFATLDVGVNGINPQTGKGNNSELFVWVADVPISKAIVCGRAGDIVTASEGEFSVKDVGSTIEWQSGVTAVISGYTSATVVTTSDSGTVTSQAAAIGNGRVMTASQTGTTVTRTAGDSFSSNDVGKTIFWANGLRSVVTEYTDADNLEVYPSQTISSQAAAMDPTSRKFNDTVTDAVLRTRMGGYSLPNRFFEPLPDCGDGIIIGVFMWCAVRDEEKVYHSQIPAGELYRAGYYNSDLQVVEFKDRVVKLREFPDMLVVYCKQSTRGIPTNYFDESTVPEVGEVVAVASGQVVLDPKIGLLDYGSVQRITQGRDRLITNEYAVRDFDGREFSMADYSYNRIRKKLQKLENATSSAYHREVGYVVWGLEE